MITYEKALEIVREWKDNIDHCTEYDTAFVFSSSEDNNYIGGYGHAPEVILKKDGTRIPMVEFTNTDPGDLLKDIDLDPDTLEAKKVTYYEPTSYFNEDMKRALEEYEEAKKKKNEQE